MLKRILTGLGVAACLAIALPAVAQAQEMKMGHAPEGKEATVSGTVIDVSCKFRHGLSGAEHRMCAQVCADKGVPLAILTDDGKLVVPVSAGMPGGNESMRLKEFAEQQVTVTGTVFKAGGAMAIEIASIKKS
jgi:hypothetical protein